jgi:hypothetical protein
MYQVGIRFTEDKDADGNPTQLDFTHDGGAIGMASTLGAEMREQYPDAEEIKVYDDDAIINGANEGTHIWTNAQISGSKWFHRLEKDGPPDTPAIRQEIINNL